MDSRTQKTSILLSWGMPLLLLSGVAHAADTVRNCDAEPTDMLISYGEFLTGDNCVISGGGEVDLFRFDAVAGDYVLLSLGDGSGYYENPCFEVRGPSNEIVIPNGCAPRDGKRWQEFTTAVAGRYLILVREDSNDATAYGLNLDRLDPPMLSSESIPCYGCEVSGNLNSLGDIDPYLFAGSAGDSILVTLIDRSGYYENPCMALRNANDPATPLGDYTCAPRDSVTTIEATLPDDGTYTLVVNEDSNNSVNFGLDVQCLFGPCAGPVPIPSGVLDIDADGEFDALTDGLLIIRYAFGFSGDALIVDAVDTGNCQRCTAAEIEARLAYVQSLWE